MCKREIWETGGGEPLTFVGLFHGLVSTNIFALYLHFSWLSWSSKTNKNRPTLNIYISTSDNVEKKTPLWRPNSFNIL